MTAAIFAEKNAHKGDRAEDGFVLRQVHVANRLGVSEERVREMRCARGGPLREGRDWVKKGATLLFAAGAVERIARVLGAPQVPQRFGGLLGWPARHRIVVAKLWPNPSYVCGLLLLGQEVGGFGPVPEKSGDLLMVRVKSSSNLVRGMVLECVHVGGTLYEAVRLPRRKGRW